MRQNIQVCITNPLRSCRAFFSLPRRRRQLRQLRRTIPVRAAIILGTLPFSLARLPFASFENSALCSPVQRPGHVARLAGHKANSSPRWTHSFRVSFHSFPFWPPGATNSRRSHEYLTAAPHFFPLWHEVARAKHGDGKMHTPVAYSIRGYILRPFGRSKRCGCTTSRSDNAQSPSKSCFRVKAIYISRRPTCSHLVDKREGSLV